MGVLVSFLAHDKEKVRGQGTHMAIRNHKKQLKHATVQDYWKCGHFLSEAGTRTWGIVLLNLRRMALFHSNRRESLVSPLKSCRQRERDENIKEQWEEIWGYKEREKLPDNGYLSRVLVLPLSIIYGAIWSMSTRLESRLDLGTLDWQLSILVSGFLSMEQVELEGQKLRCWTGSSPGCRELAS